MRRFPLAPHLLLGLFLLVLPFGAPTLSDEDAFGAADRLFEESNYAEAALAYEALADAAENAEDLKRATGRLVACHVRLQQFDPALDAATAWVDRTRGTPWEARAHRFAGNLWLSVPHWGTRSGGEFRRAQWGQGIQVRSFHHDKREGLRHLLRARDLYQEWEEADRRSDLEAELPEAQAKRWREERIECLFDVAGACARFGIYEGQWSFWHRYWGERDDLTATTAGEDDFEEYHGDWQLRRRRPIGLRLGADGEPVFPRLPSEWSEDLDDDGKLLFLLAEIRELDPTAERQYEAAAIYRQAMLARARFGADRLGAYASMYWDDEAFPLQEELETFRPWELEDGETLLLAGGRIRQQKLPPQWDVFALLRQVRDVYVDGGLRTEASYAIGVTYQSRQRYLEALAEYAALRETWPETDYAGHAENQAQRIRAAQIRLHPTGVQLTGRASQLQLSYRNATKVNLVARKIDLAGYLEEIRTQEFDLYTGPRDVWALQNWPYFFTSPHKGDQWAHDVAHRHLGPEVIRWSETLEDDGTHRYAQVELGTPLSEAGTYLVYAQFEDVPTEEETEKPHPRTLGLTRAVVAVTDLALVEKQASTGKLYYVAHADTGEPVAGATIDLVEFYSRYNQSIHKSEYHRAQHSLETDADGLALDPYKASHGGQLHILVKAGDDGEPRLAWSGMRWWGGYHPSRMRNAGYAYCITDRPVYRPNQDVKFKVWLRRMTNGIQTNQGSGRQETVRIYDPRGNRVHEVTPTTDEYGGLAGSFRLAEEPVLGLYRIQVQGAQQAGGATFRVEEYKKPEFEVTVEPGTTHAKLGETIQAKIQATYYFGAPVTDARVSYKVFREEYRHRYYPAGLWDWLYGPGYGWAWYAYDWFPWWGHMRNCWVAPDWWWGFYPSGHRWWGPGPKPIRELVQQGEAPIGEDGSLDVEIDTTAAQRDHPDRDHRYVVRAEVRDASRRVIEGEGAIKVTRQAWYAMVQPLGGWYRPGEEMVIRIHCVTPENEPVETEGMVSVAEVVWGGPDNAHLSRTEVERWKASTDENGVLEIRLRHEKSGQLEITFEAPDAWGGVVRGHGTVWVHGDDFTGRLHRFNDLEILADKRTYQPGDTAHLLVNTRRADSHVLFADRVDGNALLEWRMLHLDGRSQRVDVPIREGDAPNVFVEATTVAGMRLHQQVRRLCVPPRDSVMSVTVATDKPEYRPGETATVTVTARTPDGEPAEAQVVVSAFDSSVLYIQPEITPRIGKFFHGNLRRHQTIGTTSLVEQFASWGSVARPFQQLYPAPPGWGGVWGGTSGDWSQFGDVDFALASGTIQGATAFEGASRSAAIGLGGGAGSGSDGRSSRARRGGARDGPTSPAAPASGPAMAGEAGMREPSEPGAPGGGDDLVEATLRKRFADTALWQEAIHTGADGSVETTVEMPENLTTWKVNAWGITKGAHVGQADTSMITTKDLIVRLQAPRFFMEYDEVVLSANVHNYLETAKRTRVSIDLPAELLERIGETAETVDVDVPAGGETRVDWRVRVLGEGLATVTVQALTDEESDAMQLTFPALVHGMTKQVATTASLRPDETDASFTIELDVPAERRPELTRLEVQFAPSLVGAMLDALPYCLNYPYGCTEQTMSRFLPAVLTLKTLRSMGIRLEDVREIRRGRMEEIRRIAEGERLPLWGYWNSPVFEDEALEGIVEKGLQRITAMQNPDGGWGWWTKTSSNPYLTSYVLHALLMAREADVDVPDQVLNRGVQWLVNDVRSKLQNPLWSVRTDVAFTAYVLAQAGQEVVIQPIEGDERPGELLERLWQGRDELNLYGKALLALALDTRGKDGAKTVLRNILQYAETNDETQVSWFRTPSTGWWYWWNNDIETHAWILRALVQIEPKHDLAPRVVKWLLNNRRGGYYWRSTRDTTLCVAAMSEFVAATGEGAPDYTLRLDYDDGAVVKEIRITKENFFTYDNRFLLEGVALTGGKHTLKVTKTGPGALYLNSYLRYFTKERPITAAGHELKVARTYFLLQQIPYEVEVEGAEGQAVMERRLRYERVPLEDGAQVESGDLIQVELRVTSDNDYTFLAFEDMKPAGCEAVDLRSGAEGQEGFWSYMELRDEKVAFFVSSLEQGEHLLRYRLRAEVPGVFHALPTRLFAMYVPELMANGDELVLRIVDPEEE